MVSLGTGVDPVQETKSFLNAFKGTWARVFSKVMTVKDWFIERATAKDGTVVDQTRSWCLSAGISYHRYSPPLEEKVDLAETNDKKLIRLMWNTMAYMHEKREDIKNLVKMLKSEKA